MRVPILETKIKMELAQGTQVQKKSDRYNTSETPNSNPHLCWPNESCLTGTVRKRMVCDDMSFGQFVVGFVQNILDEKHTEMANRMLIELIGNSKTV